jgi:hypothetical protein
VKRDTKLNLIFLTIFLAASLPGAVILFRKKMQPSSRPIFMTDEVDRRVPYMAPPNTPPSYRRVIPPLTERWLADLVHERTGLPGVVASTDARGNRQPILSEDDQVQLVANRLVDGKVIVDLVWWDPALAANTARFAAHLNSPEGSTPAHVDRAEKIELPKEVKTELMNLGLLKTPPSIVWLEISAPQPASGSSSITIDYEDGNQRRTAMLPIPSSPRANEK